MIRTSRHYFSDPNTNKIDKISNLVLLYKEATQFFIDYLWNNSVSYKIGKRTIIFNIKEDKLECPSFISTRNLPFKDLSQRLIKCASTQACGIVKSVTEKRKRRLEIYAKFPNDKLKEKLEEPFTKPDILKSNKLFKCEIGSICTDLQENKLNFIQFKYLGFEDSFRLPFKYHKQSNKWKAQGKRLNSFLISNQFIEIRYDVPEPDKKTEGITVGVDQGIKTCLTLSDKQITIPNKHGHDLNSIQSILSRAKKGGLGFQRAQEHRKNYINWSINNLNFSNIKQINYENVFDIRRGKQTSRMASHWSYSLIRDKTERLCEETGVQFVEQSSVYRSQRCSECGWVKKDNRNKKVFCCTLCGFVDDADYNASCNHRANLPVISVGCTRLKLNREGFFWKESGLFTLDNQELTVPDAYKS